MKLIAPLIILFSIALCCEAPKRQPSNSTPIDVDAETLEREYNNNEVAANDKYENKLVRVQGFMESVDVVFGKTSVRLRGKTFGVTCRINKSEEGKASRLIKGQIVTAVCVCDGKGLGVELVDCELK